MGNKQITELEPNKLLYPINAIIIKQSMPWKNCACPHGCSKPVIPLWSETKNQFDVELATEALSDEIDDINKKASAYMFDQGCKYYGYIVGYFCYVLTTLICVSAILTLILLEYEEIWNVGLILNFWIVSIMLINLAVCEWHKYLWNRCLAYIETNVMNELNVKYMDMNIVWSAHSRVVQHGVDSISTKGKHSYKRKYVDIVGVHSRDHNTEIV
eukprot:269448_1